jgi:hypothetical protein
MRYFITLLVVLSFVASFGSYELESARIVGADRFSYTIGAGWDTFGLLDGITDISLHAGFEYGLSEYLSVCFKGNLRFMSYSHSDSNFLGYDFVGCLKTSFDFTDSPFSLGISLGGMLRNDPRYYYDPLLRDDYDASKTRLAGRGRLIFQGLFLYLGFQFNTDDIGYYPGYEIIVGFDFELNDKLNLLVELGSSADYRPITPSLTSIANIVVGLETTF